LRAWLLQPEGDDLEFKSSAFTDVDHRVGRKPTARTPNEQIFDIAKAVCGMLNAEGGTVVIGVAELDRYGPEELESPYRHPPMVGTRAILGIDAEHDFPGWDRYQRKLADRCAR